MTKMATCLLYTSKLNNVSVDGYTIEAEAGANLIETTRIALRHSLTGFEFACGIPGSIGGAVFMNAGAYGGEISNILQSCKVLTKDGEIETLSAKDLAFGYRHSAIQDSGAVVLSAKFALSPGNLSLIHIFKDDLHKSALTLSGGQQQRLCIARAI